MTERTYLCIDLKSFFASVECVERGLNPMTTNLVVADPERSDRTICLAVSPSMKALGVKNRCRVFEIPRNIQYIMAPPRMQTYIDYAAEIYGVYLKYISKDDIHVYSIDECFLDVTDYLPKYKKTPKEMAVFLMDQLVKELGLRSTCGIGTNLYLSKIALDITAKHAEDFIGYLNEDLYQKTLWDHRPITDFWRIGTGTARRLEHHGITSMREIAMADENLIYSLFGIDGELLIDHAWGREPTTIADIKAYKSKSNCLSSGQVLMRDYNYEEADIIVREMTDLLCLQLVDQDVVCPNVSIGICYSAAVLQAPAKGSVSFDPPTSSDRIIIPAVSDLYKRITDRNLPIRRIYINFNNIGPESGSVQLSLFDTKENQTLLEKDKKRQQAVLEIKKRFGKNAVLKGIDLKDAATTRERNFQIGGHKSGKEPKKG